MILRLICAAYVTILALAVLLVVAQVPLGYPADDPFQEAEYVIWADGKGALTPILIHGGLDVLPSRAAAAICTPDHRIICVRAINAGFQALAGALLLAAACVLGGMGVVPGLLVPIFATLPALLLFAFVGVAHGSPVAAHQGTPGIRDLSMLAALLLMALATWRPRGAITALLGALAILAPLWAYNRGLTQGVVTGLFIVGLCLLQRSARPLLAAALGALAAMGTVAAAGGVPMVGDAIADIQYWFLNAGLWHSQGAWLPIAFALAVHAAGLALGAYAALAAWRDGRPRMVLMALILVITGALYFAAALDRPDAIHLRWTLWPPALLMAMGIGALRPTIQHPMPVVGSAAAVALMALAAYLFADYAPDRWRLLPGLRANVALLASPLPTDRELAGGELVQIADRIRAAGGCAFAADNAALVHLLSGAPPCSRFAFGAYIAKSEQQSVIAELRAAGPATILWHHPAWWSNIDGRTFRENSPALAAWIEATYPVQTTIGQHILRTRD